jgi:hypothetical protein
MEIVFRCTGCGKKLVAEESGQGLLADCPACGATVTVPSPSPVPKASSAKRVVRVPREMLADTKEEEPKPPAEKPPETEPAPATLTLYPERPHNLEIIVGWICVVVGTILALLVPKAFLAYLTFFIGGFLMSCVLFIRRKYLHFIVLLLCTCIPPPLLMRQNIWRNVAPSTPPAAAASVVREAPVSPTRAHKVVIDAEGEIKVVPVTAPEPSAAASATKSASRSASTARPNAPADPFAEAVEQTERKGQSHEPKTRSAEDQYADLLKSQDDVPPLVPEDVLAKTTVGHDADFVWQKASAADTLLPGDPAAVVDVPFAIYSEEGDKETFSPTGRMGNKNDLQFDLGWDIDPHSGTTCIYVRYASSEDWVTVAWQNPGHNWGEVAGGFDLTKAKRLTFWAKGETGRENVEFMVGMEQAQTAVSRDTLRATTGIIRLKKEWKKYDIPLEELDRSRLITGFLFRIEGQGKPVVFCLDDIQFE